MHVEAMLLEHVHQVLTIDKRNWFVLCELSTIVPVMARRYEYAFGRSFGNHP
jgi:hypothetical protein